MKPKRIGTLQNTGYAVSIPQVVDITIVEGDSQWKTAHQNWIGNKPPTDSPHWKKGVWFYWKEVLGAYPDPFSDLKG